MGAYTKLPIVMIAVSILLFRSGSLLSPNLPLLGLREATLKYKKQLYRPFLDLVRIGKE